MEIPLELEINKKSSIDSDKIMNKKPPLSPRPQSASPKPSMYPSLFDCEPPASIRHNLNTRSGNKILTSKTRVRSSSAGRGPDLRARYWALLFENLRRAVDEIYQTCEYDQSELECEETILILENYTKDFRSLTKWLKLSKDLENGPNKRPTSLAWEIRKSSPAKGFLKSILSQFVTANQSTKSALILERSNDLTTASVLSKLDQTEMKEKSKSLPKNPTLLAQSDLTSTNEDHHSHEIVNHTSSKNDASFPKLSELKTNTNFQLVKEIKPSSEVLNKSLSCDNGDSFCESNGISNTAIVQSNLEDDKIEESISNAESQPPKISSLPGEIDGQIESSSNDNKDELNSDLKLDTTQEKRDDPPSRNSSSVENIAASNVEFTPFQKNLSSSKAALYSEPQKIVCPKATTVLSTMAETIITSGEVKKLLASNSTVVVNTNKAAGPLNKFNSNPHIPVGSTTATSVKTVTTSDRGSSLSKGNVISTGNTDNSVKSVPSNLGTKLLSESTKISNAMNAVTLPNSSNSKSAIFNTTNTRNGNVTNRFTNVNDPRRNMGFQERRTFTTGISGRGVSNYRGTSNQFQNRANTGNVRKQPVQTVLKHSCTSAAPKQTLPLKMISKNEPKTGSTSSISSTSSCQSWADKVKGTVPLDNSAELGSKDDVSDDNDGWETVHRGRTRSRNSPVKKIASESNLTQINDKAEINVKAFELRSNSDLHESKKVLANKKLSKNDILQTSKKPVASNKEPEKHVKVLVKRDATLYRNVSNLKQKQHKTGSVSGVLIAGKTNTLSNFSKGNSKSTDKKDSTTNIKLDEKLLEKGTEIANLESVNVPEEANQSNKPTKIKVDNIEMTCKKDLLMQVETLGEKDSTNEIPESTLVNDLNLTHVVKELEMNKETKCQILEGDNIDCIHDVISTEKSSNCITEANNKMDVLDEVSLNELSSNDCCSTSETALTSVIIEVDSHASSSGDESELNDDDIEEIDVLEDLDDLCDDYENQADVDLCSLMQEEDRVSQLGLSWGDQMDQLDLELRTPGRALQVHEKLSSPFKKRSLSETIRLQEEKQAKAQEQRERLLVEKKQRLKGKVQKAEEKKAQMEEQLEQKRLTMEIKLQKAEEKRKLQIQNRIRKARDEEEKVNEIAFINTLEAQNKRHDLLSREKDHEARLSEIQEERQKKLEEKAAKEAAAEERRKTLEAERLARLEELKEKRKLRDMKIEQQLQEKEKERLEIANQKAREREQRKSALNAAQIANAEELQKKIQQKQEESARRHEENIEQIRQKAFESTVRRYSSNNDDAPRLVPYETKKMCTVCNVLIGSEVYLLSHLRGKKHQESVKDQHQGMEPSTEVLELYNLKHIVDATSDQLNPEMTLDKERQKALKKRCKKIRQRMINRGSEWEKENIEKNNAVVESEFKQKYQKHMKDVTKHMSYLSNGNWENSTITSLERALGEFERSLEKGKNNDRLAFKSLGGLAALIQLLQLALKNDRPEIAKIVPLKTLVRACTVFKLACKCCFENSQHSLHTNKVVVLLDLLMYRLNILLPEKNSSLYVNNTDTVAVSIPTDPLVGALLSVLATAMTYVHQVAPEAVNIANNNNNNNSSSNKSVSKTNNETLQRIQDVVSYTVSMGIVDKLSHYLSNVQAPIDSEPQACDFLLNIIEFMSSLAKLMDSKYDSIFESKKEDNTQLLATFRVTQLGGAVSLLYGTLLHSGAPSRGESRPPQLPKHTEEVSLAALRMLNYLAMLDIQLFQTVLGGEGLSLQLRHIASYLLWYSSHWSCISMLHEVVLLVGHFTVMNYDNQSVIQSGQRPTILQQLSALPFPYFSDPDLTEILFPTLIACCFDHADNMAILEQDMSAELLANYLEGCLLDIHKVAAYGINDANNTSTSDESVRWRLSSRFPKNKWTTAKKFFSTTSDC